MTYEQANAVKDLAPGVMKVLEGLEVEECKRCEGKGYMDGQCINYNYCKVCRGTGKVPYTWTPQVGEWCIYKNKILLITHFRKEVLEAEIVFGNISTIIAKDSILIPGWEEIERVLQKAGYIVDIWNTRSGNYSCDIDDGNDENEMYKGVGKFFQKAMMLAVLELGENK